MKQFVNINVPVPEEVLLSLRVESDEFAAQMKTMAAMRLFEQQKLSLGQSAAFAEMDKLTFIKLLGKNNISVFAPASELEDDYQNALSW